LLGEDNIRRYVPFPVVRVRFEKGDTLFDLFARASAARITGARVVISSAEGLDDPLIHLLDECTDEWAAGIEFVTEPGEAVGKSLCEIGDERIRFAAPDRVPLEVRAAGGESRRVGLPMHPSWRPDALNCSGISGSNRSATPITGTETSVREPVRNARNLAREPSDNQPIKPAEMLVEGT
jgi:hypothetical protein